MPILIPSKNIYQVENPKVRDNVIERIEVGAVEVVPANKYEEPVFSERLNLNSSPSFETESSESSNAYPITGKAIAYSSCSIIYDKYITVDVTINRNTNNSYVKNIFLGKDKNENPYIKVNKAYEESSYFYKVPSSYVLNNDPNSQSYDLGNFVQNTIISYAGTKQKISSKTIYDIKPIRAVLTCNSSSDTNGFIDGFTTPAYVENPESNDLESFTTINRNGIEFTVTTKENFAIIETDLGGSIQIEETDTYYKIKGLKFFAGRTTYSCGTALQVTPSYSKPSYFPSQVLEVNQNVVQIEMTIYGNTIGIDLTDKTVYIPGTDKTSKKVYAVDGNELMQTSNYVQLDTATLRELDTSEYSLTWLYPQDQSVGQLEIGYRILIKNNALLGKNIMVCIDDNSGGGGCYTYTQNNGYIEQMVFDEHDGHYITDIAVYEETDKLPAIKTKFLDTQAHYAIGKETATVRCAIADYYKYGEPQSIHSMAKNIKQTINVTDNVQVSFTSSVVSSTISVSLKNGKPYTVDAYVEVLYKRASGIISKATLRIKKGETSAKATFAATNIKSIEHYSAQISFGMVFETHDKVVPMVYGANGQDKPLSVYKDGTPKVFNVLGVEFLYDGAVWQILNLQEE